MTDHRALAFRQATHYMECLAGFAFSFASSSPFGKVHGRVDACLSSYGPARKTSFRAPEEPPFPYRAREHYMLEVEPSGLVP